jgi:hypothetical protein
MGLLRLVKSTLNNGVGCAKSGVLLGSKSGALESCLASLLMRMKIATSFISGRNSYCSLGQKGMLFVEFEVLLGAQLIISGTPHISPPTT